MAVVLVFAKLLVRKRRIGDITTCPASWQLSRRSGYGSRCWSRSGGDNKNNNNIRQAAAAAASSAADRRAFCSSSSDHPLGSGSDRIRTLTEDPTTWRGSSLLSANQITPGGLRLLFRESGKMRDLVRNGGNGGDNNGNRILESKVLATAFYEASTRTACSFQAAMGRLGGTHVHVDGRFGGNTSASKKGESLEDTLRCLECYADVAVIRHPVQGSVARVAETAASKPIINAGDGVGEHPTQALLDAYTVYDELKLGRLVSGGDSGGSNATATATNRRLPPLTVAMLGDLNHGRTVHSLAKLLAGNSEGVCWDGELTLRYVSPPGLEMPRYVRHYVDERRSNSAGGGGGDAAGRVRQEVCDTLEEAADGADVLYVTRIQRERFDTQEAYNAVKGSYVVDRDLLGMGGRNSSAADGAAMTKPVVMHPLPRADEIPTEFDDDPRAAYFRQMENGMYVRMALLSLILRDEGG